MIEVSEELKQAFLSRDNLRLELVFQNKTITNEDIVSGTFQLEQSLCEEEQLVFGSVGSACLSVQVFNDDTYKGERFTAYLESGRFPVPLGKFTVVDDSLSDDRKYRSLTAYDDVYLHANDDVGAWYDGLEFPMTLKAFRDSLFQFIGIEQEEVTLANDSMTIKRTVDPTQNALVFLTVAKAICEINGVLGCMTQSGQFRYANLNAVADGLFPSPDLYPSEDLFPQEIKTAANIYSEGRDCIIKQGSFVYKDFEVMPITGCCIKEKDTDNGTYYGDEENPYVIVGNFLTYGNTPTENRTAAENFYNIVKGLTYTPTRVTVLGMPWVELGDVVSVIGKKYSIFPVLHRTMTGIRNCEDTYVADGNETYVVNMYGSNALLRQTRQRTLELTTEIDKVEAKLTEVSEETGELSSRITQTVNAIESEVTARQDADSEMSSRITQTADSIISTVASTQKEWDTGDYVMTLYGYGYPSATKYPPSQYQGKWYLDQETGIPYISNGTRWILDHPFPSIQESLESQIEQLPHSITLKVNGSTEGTISKNSGVSIQLTVLDEDGNVLDTEEGKIYLSGDVIFKSNLTDGTTQISGNNIKTGKIAAEYIAVDDIDVVSLTTNNGIKIDGNYIEFSQIYNIMRYRSGNYSSTFVQFNVSGSNIITKVFDGIVQYDSRYSQIQFLGSTEIVFRPKVLGWKDIEAYGNLIAGTDISSRRDISADRNITCDNKLTGYYVDTKSSGRVRLYYSSRKVELYHSTDSNNRLNVMYSENPTGIFCKEVITGGSSRTIKDNIEDITEEEANKLLDLRPVEFDYKWGEHKEGLIAEEVREVYPGLVYEPENFDEESFEWDPNHFQSVPSLDYTRFVPYLIKLCQNQQKQIDELQNEVKVLKERMNGESI